MNTATKPTNEHSADTLVETRIQRKRREKKEHILEKALTLLNEKGLGEISLNQLAKALDYVPAALYRYFDNWESLLFNLQILVLKKARLDLLESLGPFLEKSEWEKKQFSQEETLLHILKLSEWCCQFAEKSPNEFGLLSQMLADPKHLLGKENFAASSQETILFLAYFSRAFLLAKKVKALNIKDINEITFTFVISTLGLLQSRKLTRFIDGIPQGSALVQNHTATLLIGWGGNAKLIHKLLKKLNKNGA